MTRRPLGAVVAALLGLAGCTADGDRACPAVDHGSSLVVHLGDGWAPGPHRTVSVACPGGCGTAGSPLVGALDDDAATFTWVGGAEDVVVTVTGPGEHVEVATDLVWRQVGGTAECGGPMEATVTVPAP